MQLGSSVWSQEKKPSSVGLQPSLGPGQAVAAGARGEGKKARVQVFVSLAGVSGKTELYPVVSCPEKPFSAHRSLLRATWGCSIRALSLTQA